MNNKAHLFIEGLNQIINIRSSINLGLSQFLSKKKKNFLIIPGFLLIDLKLYLKALQILIEYQVLLLVMGALM